jgi:hypothetical protein
MLVRDHADSSPALPPDERPATRIGVALRCKGAEVHNVLAPDIQGRRRRKPDAWASVAAGAIAKIQQGDET